MKPTDGSKPSHMKSISNNVPTQTSTAATHAGSLGNNIFAWEVQVKIRETIHRYLGILIYRYYSRLLLRIWDIHMKLR